MKQNKLVKFLLKILSSNAKSDQEKEMELLIQSYNEVAKGENYYDINDLCVDIEIITGIQKPLTKVNQILKSLVINYRKGYEVIFGDLIFTYKLHKRYRYPILGQSQNPNLNSINLEKCVINDDDGVVLNALYEQIQRKLEMGCAIKIYNYFILLPFKDGKTKILFSNNFINN